ncbi:MAG: sensor histidine kinase [Limnochordales bacterium]|nr:sensor histidine kinase [Limnochordales bacterium]
METERDPHHASREREPSGIAVYTNLRWFVLGALALLVLAVVTTYPWIIGFYPAFLLTVLVALGLIANTIWLLWFRRGVRLQELAVLEIFLDTAGLTGLVYLTGGRESPLLFGYGMIILAAGALLGRRLSYLSALFSFIFLLLMLFLEAAGVLPGFHVADIWRHFGPDRRSPGQVAGAVALVLVLTGGFAVLSAYLSGLAEERQRRLLEAERHRDELHRRLLHQVVASQEEERERIARELHDETGQLLSAFIMRLDLLQGRIKEKVAGELGGELCESLARLRELADRALQGVHRLGFDLRPALLDDLGLVAASASFVRAACRETGVEPSVTADPAWPRLPRETETELYRVLQEAVRNVIRHARATRVWLRFQREGQQLRMEVIDNGRGFDTETVWRTRRQNTQALGILGMEERVGLIGGTLIIDSHPGSGCRVTVVLPYDRVADKE